MKKVLCSLLVLFMAAAMTNTVKADDKELKKELSAKTSKDIRKEAKKLENGGWQIMPGKLPLEKQLEQSQIAQLRENDEGESFFIVGSASVVGGNYTIAKQMADNNAKLEICRSLSDMVATKLTQELSNMDLGNNQAEALLEVASAAKSVSSMQIKGTEYLLEIFRDLGKGKTEVRVVMAISREKAMSQAREEVKKSLKDKSSQYLKDIGA